MTKLFHADIDLGLVGEIDVRRELAAEGWLTINTNTEKGNFPNVDLIAAKGTEARAIQVKTSDAEKGSHAHCLFMGRGQGWLTNKTPFYNSKPGPLRCSVVVLVHAQRLRSRFVVLPVALAEQLAREIVERWYRVPMRDGAQRSAGFDARPQFTRLRKNHVPAHVSVQRTLLAFEDRWDVLDHSIAELEDFQRWSTDLSAMALST
ncbi:MAG: hypothetical protein ABL888_11940 [Pirellulaceae bacterium]